jgi:peptide/nickel transport system permease protein
LSDIAEAAVEAENVSTRKVGGTTVLRSMFSRPIVLVSAILLLVIVLATIFASVLAPYNPLTINLSEARAAPSAAHLLGTDLQGRDVLSRLLYAGRASLTVGVGAVLLSLIIGIPLGAIAGYYGRWIGAIIMRITDVVLSFPIIVLTIVAVAVLGNGIWQLILLLGLFSWTTICRLVRSVVIAQRELDHVTAARSLGASDLRILMRYILPSTVGVVVVNATFGVAMMVLIEASLSFLGLGIQPPTPSWGNMLTDAQSLGVLETMPWLWVPPIVVIGVTIICINFLGDGLQKALDPRLRSR